MKRTNILLILITCFLCSKAQSSYISVSEMLRLYNGKNYSSAVKTLESKGFKYQGYDNLIGGGAKYYWAKNCDLESAALRITRMSANNSGVVVTCDYDTYSKVMKDIGEELYSQSYVNLVLKQITALGYKKGYSGSNGQFYVKNSSSPVLLVLNGSRAGYNYKKLSIWSYAGYNDRYGEKKPANAKAVDLGLSVLWADRNLGATDVADYGKIGTCPFSYWTTGSDDYSGNKDDKARNEWGGNWRIPTQQEIQELCRRCKRTIVTLSNNVVGLKLVGPNGNSIVLPLAGLQDHDNNRVVKPGDGGQYWTSSRRSDYMQVLSIGADGDINDSNFSPSTEVLMSIRPVMNKDASAATSASNTSYSSPSYQKDELLENAERGDKNSQFALGVNLLTGNNGYSQNQTKGFEWVLKAARQGHIRAQAYTGYCYYMGVGTSKDAAKAVFWYNKAATGGNAEAQCNLGVCYMSGNGVARDRNKAIYWYKIAARNGSNAAIENLRDLGIYNY